MIKWRQKGWKSTGVHHGAIVFLSMRLCYDLFGPLAMLIVGAMLCGWYIASEYYQNGVGFGLDRCEHLDWLVPLDIYLVTIARVL